MSEAVRARPWYAPRSPDEITTQPWLHPEAVKYLEELLQPDWSVLEHGAGGSTLWLAARAAKVVTVEHDQLWAMKVRELAPTNVTLLTQLPAKTLEPYDYDLFLIDGERSERGECLDRASMLVKRGGWVVLDNANRPAYAGQREGLREIAKLKARFDNNIPISHYFVTEFWRLSCGSE